MSVETKAKINTIAHKIGSVLLTVLVNMNASTAGGRVRTV